MPYEDRDWIQDEDERLGRHSRPLKREKKGHGLLIGLLAGFGVLCLLCCGGVFLGYHWLVGPTSFPAQTEDYTEARSKFQTKLLTKGRAPQAWLSDKPPIGVQEIDYFSGNLRLKAWVDKPVDKAAPKPAVLFLHNGFAFGDDDWAQAQPFRDAGYITMLPKLRGENGLPGSYSMFYDEVEDVLAATDALAKLPGVDPKRLYVAGHSVGGTLAMLAAMSSNHFRAAASFSGSADQVVWSRGQPELVPFDPKDQREFQMRSPLAFPRSFKCPVRLFYGSDEFLFRKTSEKMAELATAAGLDVQALEVNGDHSSAVAPAMQLAIQFFNKTK
jgi:dipeptidyl aminopeptidase/acylaminoacyl peptidase